MSIEARRAVRRKRHWIFDMDGTLTVSVHDFEAIRRELGLPSERPILETLASLPEAEAEPLRRRLVDIERRLVGQAQAAEGAAKLLSILRACGSRLGIVTRNSRRTAEETLEACGLARFFEAPAIIGREQAAPKPDPEGIRRLLSMWGASPPEAVMVGDFRFDLEAGRAAGVTTVYVDTTERFPWRDLADTMVGGLDQLLPLDSAPN